MANFSTEGKLSVVLDDSSVQDAKAQLENELGAVAVGGGGTVSSQLQTATDGGTAINAAGGGAVSGLLDTAEGIHETVQEILELLEDGDPISGGGGGGGFLRGLLTGGGAASLSASSLFSVGGALTLSASQILAVSGVLGLAAASVLAVTGTIEMSAGSVLTTTGVLTLAIGSIVAIAGVLSLPASAVLAVVGVVSIAAAKVLSVTGVMNLGVTEYLSVTGVLTIAAGAALAVTGVLSLPAAAAIAVVGTVTLAAAQIIDIAGLGGDSNFDPADAPGKETYQPPQGKIDQPDWVPDPGSTDPGDLPSREELKDMYNITANVSVDNTIENPAPGRIEEDMWQQLKPKIRREFVRAVRNGNLDETISSEQGSTVGEGF